MSFDMHCGTCTYTEKQNGEGIEFDMKYSLSDYDQYRSMYLSRIEQVKDIVDELHEPRFL